MSGETPIARAIADAVRADRKSARQYPAEVAAAVSDGLEKAGYSIIPTADLEKLEETASDHRGMFPSCEVIKPSRDEDFYVGWSRNPDAPVIAGTRAEMLAADCPASRLRRADENGTSYRTAADGCSWDSRGLVAEQRGFLPRANLAAYTRALIEERKPAAWDLLEPFEGETEVRRD